MHGTDVISQSQWCFAVAVFFHDNVRLEIKFFDYFPTSMLTF